MFEGTKKKVNTYVNDRVTAPVHTAIVISVAAFLIAGIALVIVVNRTAA